MKRIALIGNMNNNFYALTRYLRDEGYDAHLFYRLAMEHFQPAADSYTTGFEVYCHEVDWLDNGFHNLNEKKITASLSGFDFYIGQGEEAAAAYRCGFNIDVYYPYGSDVYKYARLPKAFSVGSKIKSLITTKNRPTYRQMKAGTMAKYLHGAIVNARYICADVTNDEFNKRLKELNPKGVYKNIPLPFIYAPEYEQLNEGYIPPSAHTTQIQQIKNAHDFVLLYHGRQEWKTYHNEFTGKNTHHLIQGFAAYINRGAITKACLVMLEYGSDVEASKKLIAELGIEQYVQWFPKMYRKELMYIIKLADVCCGEFAHSYLTFGTVVEAMLMQKPVITYRQDDLYKNNYPVLYPCFNAREHEAITEAIAYAVNNIDETKKMGQEAYGWVKQYFIQNPLSELINIIQNRH